MSLTVIGSVAFDSVKTPFGERERMLGGSAIHFALAASFFAEVSVVGTVGEDFGAEELGVLRSRGIATDDLKQVPGGKTFFWRGHYDYDLNTAHTEDTQLNVFGDFAPKLSPTSAAADIVFLGNIGPDLQREVHGQCEGASFVALDSMNLWIETARDSLLQTIASVDCLLLNDAEIRMLTGKPNLAQAAQTIIDLGPSVVVAKQGEYGAVLFTADSSFAIPGYPLEDVIDPTGAGDSFAGGFLGFLAMHGPDRIDDDALRRAMAYGSVMASFNVQDFGTERVRRLGPGEILERFRAFLRLTQFEEQPIEIRA